MEQEAEQKQTADHKLLSGLIRYTMEQKEAEEALKKRTERIIRYQAVLLDLAKRVDNATLDLTLQEFLEADARTLEVERVSIWLFNEDRSEIICKDLYAFSAHVHKKGLKLRAKEYPSYFQALEETRILAATDACMDPRTSEFTENYLKPLGITSMMDIPVRRHGKVVGVVCHEHTGAQKEWSLEEQEFAGSIADMVSLALETSARKEAEERSRIIIETALDAVITMNHEGNIYEFNEAAEKLFGYPRSEVLGKPMANLIIPPSLRERHRQGLLRYLATGNSTLIGKRIEMMAMRRDGKEFPVELTVNRLTGAGPSLFAAFIRDITEQKAFERMKEGLFRDAAHELRTPYAMIKMGLEMMERGFRHKKKEKTASGKKIIKSNVDRLEHDVESILDFYKLEAGVSKDRHPVEPIAIEPLLKEVVKGYAAQLKTKGLKSILTIAESLPPLQIAREDLVRVLRNILDNSIKFTDRGRIAITVSRKGEGALIAIQDTGRGIPREDLNKVFEKFFKGQPGIQGVGLGLSITKLLLEQAGGSIDVASEGADQGTTVTLAIPFAVTQEGGRL